MHLFAPLRETLSHLFGVIAHPSWLRRILGRDDVELWALHCFCYAAGFKELQRRVEEKRETRDRTRAIHKIRRLVSCNGEVMW